MKLENKLNERQFLSGLTDLTIRTGISVHGCGCCNSPYLLDDASEHHPESFYYTGQDGGNLMLLVPKSDLLWAIRETIREETYGKPAPESTEYDLSIHTNPSADAWTQFFYQTYPNCNVDKDVMRGWFANAMMAMHDHIKGNEQTILDTEKGSC
jgi:hypothetical protein